MGKEKGKNILSDFERTGLFIEFDAEGINLNNSWKYLYNGAKTDNELPPCTQPVIWSRIALFYIQWMPGWQIIGNMYPLSIRSQKKNINIVLVNVVAIAPKGGQLPASFMFQLSSWSFLVASQIFYKAILPCVNPSCMLRKHEIHSRRSSVHEWGDESIPKDVTNNLGWADREKRDRHSVCVCFRSDALVEMTFQAKLNLEGKRHSRNRRATRGNLKKGANGNVPRVSH